VFFLYWKKISPATAATIIGESLNHRVGKSGKNLSIPQVAGEASRQNKTLEEILALPELEEWIYSDGKKTLFVLALLLLSGEQVDCLEI